MKILMVIDQFDDDNNGTTISARRFAETLRQHGNEVRVVSTGAPSENKYPVKERHIPIVTPVAHSQGMAFAQPCRTTLREAIAWADVVHFPMPFSLSRCGLRIAEKMGVPHTAAFHVQPENITSTIRLGKARAVNNGIYRYFKNTFYDRFTHIHCPSRFIAGELERNGYRAKLHVISNGVDRDFIYRKLPKSKELEGKFVILNVGRFSNEKRQDLLIEAAKKSKYADRIQLVLAGKGPKRNAYLRQGCGLGSRPILRFFSKPELIDMIAMSDLYVHCADAEIEAISCMEAFCGGLVPVIADSPKSATPQFALDERSLFQAGNSSDLAQKIDYWIEQEDERRRMEKVYSEHGKQYNIDSCVEQMEGMFRQAIEEARHG